MDSILKKEYNKLLSYTRYRLGEITDIDAEEGEQNFKDYKKRMKDDNSSGAANLSNE